MSKQKKKKGCLGKLIGFFLFGAIIVIAAAFLLDDDDEYFGDGGDDYDYISQQEIDSGNEDVDWLDFIGMFFDYYGYYPDENDSDDYYYSDYYDQNDYDSYAYNNDYSSSKYDNFYNNFDRNNDYSNYYDNYYNNYSYDNDYDNNDDWDYNKKPSSSESSNSGNSGSSNVTSQTVSKGSLSKFVQCAKSYLGTPYVWGGNSRSGIDCSGLIYNAAQEAGLGTLPRTAKTLHGIATKINKSDLSEGDLVFFASGGSISHVAIYLGNNQMIHAVSDGSETGVIISKLTQDYWKNHYYSSGRIMSSSVTEKRAETRARARSR